jgi:prolyl-tRNA synthetase
MSRPYTIQPITDPGTTAGIHYRIADPTDNRIATCYDRGNAKTIVDALNKSHADARRDLIAAAIFAASVIRTGGMYDMSEQIAYQKLEEALTAAGVKVDTEATREYDAHHTQGSV